MTNENEIIEEVTYDSTEELCEIIREGEDYFLVDLESGERSEPLKIATDGIAYILPKNRANRKWATVNKVKTMLDNGERFTMTYKASKKFGPIGNKLPNEKLISYLPVEIQEEYKAIIARAIQARNDAKAKPMTALEKAEAKLAKAQAELEKLLAEVGE